MGNERGYMECRIHLLRADARGDYLFDPASRSRHSKDDDHIAQIIELIGDILKSILIYNCFAGQLRNDHLMIKVSVGTPT